MSAALSLWNKLEGKPLGKWLFSRIICFKAPYFASIKPRFEALAPGHARVRMAKRRAVTNHIGTVHAIAMCNLAELAGGTATDAAMPKNMRWLPKSMKVDYLQKAQTDLTGECRFEPPPEGPARDFDVTVNICDQRGEDVMRAVITMYLSPKKAGS